MNIPAQPGPSSPEFGAESASRIVAKGYDTLDGQYRDWAAQAIGDDPRAAWVERLAGMLPSGNSRFPWAGESASTARGGRSP